MSFPICLFCVGDMPGAAFTLDHAAHISSWSGEAAAWFGRPAGQVLGQHCRAVFSGALLEALEEARESTRTGREYNRSLSTSARANGRYDTLLNCYPMDGGAGLLCQVSALVWAEEEAPGEARSAFVDAVMRTSPFGLGMLDTDLRYVMVNDALAEFNGITAEEHIGRSVSEMVRAADEGEYERRLRRVLETGEPMRNVIVDSRTLGRPDRDKAWSVTFFRLTGEGGRVLGLGGLMVDVTGRQTALLEASAVRQRLALVNQASSKVGRTLEMGRTARELTDVVVPEFADAATVEIRKDFPEERAFPAPDRPVTTVCLASRSSMATMPEEPVRTGSGGPSHAGTGPGGLPGAGPGAGAVLPAVPGSECTHAVGSPSHGVLSRGRPWHQETHDGELFHTGCVCSEFTAGLSSRGRPGSVVMAPLVARGRCLGLVTFLRSAERDPLGNDDLRVVEELAARTALSLDNARLYDEERRVAVALQRRMLPDEEDLPERSGLDFAWHYASSSRTAKVGGDWFDVIPLSGHRVALVVGDMMGHDIHAAAGMGQLRTAMHTLARLDLEPVDLLHRLDDIVQRSAAMQHATCLYGVYNTVSRECSIVNAGHPPPVLRYGDGRTEVVRTDPGVPLGVGLHGGEAFSVLDLTLPEEATLVLYTDGLVERRGEDIDVGIEALRSSLGNRTYRTAAELCEGAVSELKERTEDDLVVLMARAVAVPGHRSDRRRFPPEERSVPLARDWVGRRLAEWGLGELSEVARLLISELATNAVRHALGDIDVRLAKGETLVVEVADDDERLPRVAQARAEDEWGRGLALVEGFAGQWGARSISSGKVVWFELPLGGAGSPQDAARGPGPGGGFGVRP